MGRADVDQDRVRLRVGDRAPPPASTPPQPAPLGVSTGLGHRLVGAVAVASVANDPAAQPGEVRWGGIAVTQWWISPRSGPAVPMMALRHMAFWHPFSLEFKRLAYQAMGP